MLVLLAFHIPQEAGRIGLFIWYFFERILKETCATVWWIRVSEVSRTVLEQGWAHFVERVSGTD